MATLQQSPHRADGGPRGARTRAAPPGPSESGDPTLPDPTLLDPVGDVAARNSGSAPVKAAAVPADVVQEACARTPESGTVGDRPAGTRTQDRARAPHPGGGPTTVTAWEGDMVQGADPATARGTARQRPADGRGTDARPQRA
jgi:hypothetical protein